MLTEQQVLDAMRNIIDPDLGRDIVSLGFIKDLTIQDGDVRFKVELTTPACPMKAHFKTQCEQAVAAVPGVRSVAVTMSAMARPHQPAQEQEPNTLEDVDTLIAISSCKGGVGKSTVALLLARALQQQGLAVGVLDADIYGPSFPTLLNLHHTQIFMRDNKLVPIDFHGLKVMSFGFVLQDSPAVLRGPIVSSYINQLLTQTDWGHLDCLIIDMPPGTGDIQLTITQRAALDGAVIVTTPQSLALVDVAKGILMFEQVEVPVLGLVENMTGFTCDACGKKHYIFGSSVHSLKERFGLTTLAEIPILPGIASLETLADEAIQEPFKQLAQNLMRELGKRRKQELVKPVATPLPGHLHIQWPDGAESTLSNVAVRASCTCAQCVNEFTGEPLLDPASIPEDLEIKEVLPLGNYAVAITWSDGHGSGIFSWDHLRNLDNSLST